MKDHYINIIDALLSQDDFPGDAFHLESKFKNKQIIVYGAGECCHWFVEIVIKIHGFRPKFVLDQRFFPGDCYEGIPALAPNDFRPTPEEVHNFIVVVCVGKSEYHSEILNYLHNLGFEEIIFLLDVYEIHNPFNLPIALRKEGFGFYKRHQKQISQTLEKFNDEESWQVYTGCLQTHMQRKPVPLPARPRHEQYFPQNVPLNKGYDRFVCCGAYDGDSIRELHKSHNKVDEIICFEPEIQIFQRLVTYLRENKTLLANRITTFPCAVYSKSVIMKFLSGHGLGSRIFANGNTYVQTVSLDEALLGQAPTFICMDVEGVELEVLKGAEKLLRQSTPDLAVCVYHSPEHLWQIPAYLDGLNLGYRFYLRNYTTFTIETVLYATTESL